MRHQHVGHRYYLSNGDEVAFDVVGQFFVRELIERDGGSHKQNRVTVGRRLHHRLDPEHVAAAGLVFNEELAARHFGHMRTVEASHRVHGAAGCNWNDDLDRLDGIA